MNNFEIDPSHYVTLPAFGWDAMLKMTKVKLDLLTDVNMYNFFTNGVRGGISTINHRYAKANNPYVCDYNTDQPSSYIIYMDNAQFCPSLPGIKLKRMNQLGNTNRFILENA